MSISMKNKYLNFILVFFVFALFVNSSVASESYEVKDIGVLIQFEEKNIYRTAPKLLVEQAKVTLPNIEENVKILCERPNGFIDGLSYSMLCYSSKESGDTIHILGEVRSDNKLWNYQVKLPKGNLANDVIIIIESLSKFTYNKLQNLHSLRSFGRAKSARPFEGRYNYFKISA